LAERLAHSAEILRDEQALLDRVIWKEMERVEQNGGLIRVIFLEKERAIQRRIIRVWLETKLGSLQSIGFNHVDAILRFIGQSPPQGRLSLPGKWEVVKEYEMVRLQKREHGMAKFLRYSYTLPREGEVVIPEAGLEIQCSRHLLSSGARPQDELEALFDSASLLGTLTVRNHRTGDRFQPLGMRGHKKIKDLFIEKKVPLAVRHTLPLLLSGEDILWIPRYGRSDLAKAGPESKEILKVRLETVGV
jgi:tRNA(Ile)-lysidine synthase